MNDCIVAVGAPNSEGYHRGTVQVGPRVYYSMSAHRVAYEAVHGPLPAGAVVRHSCDNTECVNPEHLLVGTFADNTADMVSRGRHGNLKKTHCPEGHPLEGENLVIYELRRGWRKCRTCDNTRARARHAARLSEGWKP